MTAITYSDLHSGHAAKPLFCSDSSATVAGMKTLDELRALPESTPPGVPRSGVYFLWDGDELVYVGASKDTAERRHWHWCSWRYRQRPGTYQVRVKHDRFTCFHAPADEMRALERAYIAHYNPRGNIQGKRIVS